MHVPSFNPSPDVAAILNALLDIYERRDPQRPIRRAIRVRVSDVDPPGYASQIDPMPRLIANEQLSVLECQGLVQLHWPPGQEGHLLEAVTLAPEHASDLFPWLDREPVAARRAALRDLLLGDRFRFAEGDWRRLAVNRTLAQLRAGKSPAPFTLTDPDTNRDLLTALCALDWIGDETPYRVFSVRVFNDSKVFDGLKGAIATLAQRHVGEWRVLSRDEVLRELGLVSNPTLVLLSGPWRLVNGEGEVMVLDPFRPAVGVPALMAAHTCQVTVDTTQVQRVVCVENPTSFHELVRHEGEGLAALCLWGNPAPPVRHLLSRLVETLPADVPLRVWADLDYGGLNIVAGLRRRVSARFALYRMDVETLEAHARWARPLTASDRRLLLRLQDRPILSDLRPLIDAMLQQGLKLEQEAVQLDQREGP